MQDVVELPAEVYRKIIRHCLKGLSTPTITGVSKYNQWNEVIGALIGTFKPGKVKIEDAIELGEGTSTYVLATDYSRIFEKSNLEAQLLQNGAHDEDRVSICGWYHSHPGYGFFLSGTDKRTQTLYQQQHTQAIALVADPTTIGCPNEAGIRVFRVYDNGIFGPNELQLDYIIEGLDQKYRETLRTIADELGIKQIHSIFPLKPFNFPKPIIDTPLTKIQVNVKAPDHTVIGKPFSISIGVQGIQTGSIRLSYKLLLPENLKLLSQPWKKGYSSHNVMTNGTFRVIRLYSDIEDAYDIILDKIIVKNLNESISLDRQEITVIGHSNDRGS